MAISPDMAEDLARAVSSLYEEAELVLVERIRAALAQGLESPRWAELKARALGDLSAAVQAVIDALAADATDATAQAVAEAYTRGQQAAVAELGAVGVGQAAAAAEAIPAGAAVDRLAAAAVEETSSVHQRILRASMDAYRDVIARASAAPLTGANTRRQAAQRALDKFAARGITGFIDARGRAWDMVSYTEMATRSAVGRAAVQAHTDRLGAAGVELVRVSRAPEECPLCRPWEGKVLLREGPGGGRTVQVRHATENRTVTVRVSGSLREAREAGLLHPNCRHQVSAYFPGLSRALEPVEQRGTYEDTQQQRYLERQVRAWKRRAAAAMTEDARRRANARVRAYQARIRELTADTGLPRKSHREQITGSR
ncbi:phage minor capsid protein [Streptomyces nanhaiensis]|uniref:phage minor capsid protein n=1 Tax=Streptomyces nanhaiensis TaxID=679319 RepID=UPI00399D326E